MATIKTDDVFSIASFDPSKLAESFRDFAEKGAQQSKDAYAKLKTAGEEAGKTLEATVQTAQAGTVEIGLKAIDVLRVNAESSLSHMEALLGVKSAAEFFELQTSFLRKLLAYQETWRQGLHKRHLGIPNFRVLTATTSRERVEHLVAACRSLPGGGSRLFLFTDQERLAGGDILGQGWVNGRGEQLRLCANSREAEV